MTTTAAMYAPLFRANPKKKPTEKKGKESKSPAKRNLKETLYGTLEAARQDELGRKVYPVTLIREGMGNLHDRNYYTADAVKSGVPVYNGKKAYYDHPTQTEERERPGRSVREISGHYENVRAEKGKDGRMELKGDFVPMQSDTKKDVVDMLEHAINYKKKFPDQDFIGISINGDGEGHQMDYEDFISKFKPTTEEMKKISQIEGQQINVVNRFTEAVSADLVTEPGAGGNISESKKLIGPLFSKQNKTVNKESKTLRGNNMLDAVKKLFRGLSENNKEVIEIAVKEMQQSEAEGENEKKEAEAKKGMYEAIMKKMKQMKKDMKKDDGDSDDQHESKMLQAACEAYEADCKKESEKKEGENEKEDQGDQQKADKTAKDGDGKGAAGAAADDDKSKEKKEGESESEAEKKEKEKKEKEKEAEGKKEGEGKKDPMESMQAEMESLKKEIESLKKEKKESEASEKGAKESAAHAKAELHIKKRNELINSILGDSSLPASVQDEYRRVLKECKTDEEIKGLGKKLVEAGRSLIEQAFIKSGNIGFGEKQSYAKDENTDAEFLK